MYCIREIESWEHPDIYWYECAAKPNVDNLTSFPFKNTMCEYYKENEDVRKTT